MPKFKTARNSPGAPTCASLEDEWIEKVPKRYRGQYRKALYGEATLKHAIRAKCAECCGFEGLPGRIEDCNSYGCPLWAYRPVRRETCKS